MQRCSFYFIMNNYQDWEKLLRASKISDELIEKYLMYISQLFSKHVPIIFEIKHLSLLLGQDIQLLYAIINASQSFYRKFYIPKHTGGWREIDSPYPVLQNIQKWILVNILNKVNLHENSFAYTRNKGIIDNAKQHFNCKEMLNIDITDFFGSINIKRVISVFKGFGYTNLLSYQLASICCYNNKLPQGACTSPALSNIVSKRLDSRLTRLANEMNLRYTRYADDITFSGPQIPKNIISMCRKILFSEGFKINEKKTKFKPVNSKKTVTGLNVHKDRVTVQKHLKRELRKEIYFIKNYGLINHCSHINTFDPMYIERIIGKLNFLLNVEPNNIFAIDALEYLSSNYRKY